MSNAFCRSINIIPGKKPSSNPFKTLSVKKAKHGFAEWLPWKADWSFYHLIERHLFSHELPFQWSSKLTEAMKLFFSQKNQFSSTF